MTLPNGAAGIPSLPAFGITGDDGSMAGIATRTQDAVMATLKAQVQVSPGWNTATAAVFADLRKGVPLPLAIIEAIVQQLFNTVEEFPAVQNALNAIEQVPGVKQLEGILSAALDNLDGTAQAIESFLFNGDGTATIQGAIADAVAAVQDFFDGTAQWVSGLRLNSDGTASYGPVLGFHPVRTLVDFLDGTAQAAGSAIHNLLDPAGTHQYVRDAVNGLITGVGGTVIADVVGAISNGVTALTRLASLISGIGGTTIADVVAVISNATANITALISGVSGTVIADVVSAINNGVTALTRIASLIAGVTGASTITDVVNAINAATSKLTALISGVSGTVIGDVVTAINNATTSINALISGVGGAVIADVVTAIANGVTALSRVASLISGVGGSTITDVVTAINNATSKLSALISGVSGTVIADVVTAINNGVTALARIASLISGVGGTVIGDVSTAINNATTSISALISGVSGTVIADVVTAVNKGVTALSNIASLISGVSGATIADVVTVINAATTKLAALISGVSGTVIADVVTAINNGVTALARITSLISGVGGTVIGDVSTAINAATTKLSSLISGIGGTVIGDVVTLINKIQSIIDTFVNIFHADSSTGNSIATLLAQAQAALKGLLPGIFDNSDGSAGALGSGGVTVNSDGTAVFSGIVGATYGLLDNIDGTAMTVAKALQNMLAGAGGTHNFALGNWDSLLSNAGLPDVAAFLKSLSGLLPAALDNLDGSALASGVAQLTQNLDGTATLVSAGASAAITSLVDHLDGTAQNAFSTLLNAAPRVSNVIAALQTTVDGAVQGLENVFTSGSSPATFGTALGNFLTGLFNSHSGQTATSASYTDVASAVSGTMSTVGSHGGSISSLQGQMGAAPNYTAAGVIYSTTNFKNVADTTSVPSGFTNVPYTILSGDQLGVLGGSALARVGISGSNGVRYNTATTFDNQVISVTLAATGDLSSLFLIGRCNSAGTSMVLVWIVGNTLNMYGIVSNSPTTFVNAFTVPDLKAGATYSLYCGTANGSRRYDVQCDGTSIIGGEFNDAGVVSQVGSTFRFGGFGAGSLGGNGQVGVSSFTLADNTALLTAPGVPTGAFVTTSEATTSSTYANLTTTTDSVTVNIGSSGAALVIISCQMLSSANIGYMAYDISGATTRAASDDRAYVTQNPGTTQTWGGSFTHLETGLTAGSTTFKAKYRNATSSSTAFKQRRIDVIPY